MTVFNKIKSDFYGNYFLYFQCSILLVFGLIYVFLIPPLEAPDEFEHFARAYGVAEGQFILKYHSPNLVSFWNQADELRSSNSFPILKELMNQQQEKSVNIAWNTSLYSPLAYIIYALVIKCVMLINFSGHNVLFSFYLCRITSLVLFISVFFFCSRCFTNLRWSIFWITITPMALSQFSIVSLDFVLFSSTLLLITCSIGHLTKKIYKLFIFLGIFFLLLSKISYIPLLSIPIIATFNKNNRCRKSQLRSIFLAILTILPLAVIWSRIAQKIYYDPNGLIAKLTKQLGVNINPNKQLLYIFRNPMHFIEVIINTITFKPAELYHQFVGILGRLDTPIPFWLTLVWGVFAAIAILVSHEPENLTKKWKIWLGLLCLVSACLTFASVVLSVYLLFVSVDSTTVGIIQGRHLHTIMLAVFVGLALLNPFQINYKWEITFKWSLILTAIIINLFAIKTIVDKYY